jgi:hypothetical protein
MRLRLNLRLRRVRLFSEMPPAGDTVGVILVAVGIALVLTVTPGWFWLAALGLVLMRQGWLLVNSKNKER